MLQDNTTLVQNIRRVILVDHIHSCIQIRTRSHKSIPSSRKTTSALVLLQLTILLPGWQPPRRLLTQRRSHPAIRYLLARLTSIYLHGSIQVTTYCNFTDHPQQQSLAPESLSVQPSTRFSIHALSRWFIASCYAPITSHQLHSNQPSVKSPWLVAGTTESLADSADANSIPSLD